MKFTEEKLEGLFSELLSQQGYPHAFGETLVSKPEQVLLEDDLLRFLLQQYRHEGITVTEVQSILLQLRSLSASHVYETNKMSLKILPLSFFLIARCLYEKLDNKRI